MKAVLDVTIPVFALVFCGYVAASRKLLAAAAIEGINAFVFWFALPAMLFRVVAQRPLGELMQWRLVGGYLAAAMLVYLLAYRASRAGLIVRPAGNAIYSASVALHITHGNVGYLGLALVAQVNPRALPTVALVIIGDILVTITLSMMLMERGRAQQGADTRPAWAAVVRSLSRSPLVVSIGAGLMVALAQIKLPTMADNFLVLLSSAAGPGALFAIGATLAGQRLRIDREIALLLIGKLLVLPLVVAISLFLVFRPEGFAAGVAVVCAALPGAANSYILAQRYGLSTHAISGAIAAGTIASVVTVSFVIWAVGLA